MQGERIGRTSWPTVVECSRFEDGATCSEHAPVFEQHGDHLWVARCPSHRDPNMAFVRVDGAVWPPESVRTHTVFCYGQQGHDGDACRDCNWQGTHGQGEDHAKLVLDSAPEQPLHTPKDDQ